jgi:hypothetical protein
MEMLPGPEIHCGHAQCRHSHHTSAGLGTQDPTQYAIGKKVAFIPVSSRTPKKYQLVSTKEDIVIGI